MANPMIEANERICGIRNAALPANWSSEQDDARENKMSAIYNEAIRSSSESSKNLARLILKTVEIHETSYKKNKSESIGEYSISIGEASLLASEDPFEALVIYLLLANAWNDTLDTVRVLLGEEK